jgi:hypothetical protein
MKKSGFFIVGAVIILAGIVLYFLNRDRVELPDILRNSF